MVSGGVMLPTLQALLISSLLTQAPVPSQPAKDEKQADRATVALERLAKAAEQIAADACPVPSPSEAQVPATAPPPAWTGNVGLGLISVTGNGRQITVSGNAAAQYRSEHWIWGGKVLAAYGRGTGVGESDSQVTALNAAVGLQGDRRLTEMFSLFLGTGVDSDHVKSVELRGYGEGGLGIIWIDQQVGKLQKSFLRTDFGFRYARELRFQYYLTELNLPDVTLVAPRAALSFRYAINDSVAFTQEAEVMPNITGTDRLLVNTMSKINARLFANVSLGLAFAVRYDSAPAAGRVPTDTALTVGLEAAL